MIILDVDMLDEQIFKLINVLKSLQKSLNILLIGSSDKISLISNAFATGVISYLVKPLSSNNVCDFLVASLKLQKNNPSTL
jgi:response regulator of citrate/malate metabolism